LVIATLFSLPIWFVIDSSSQVMCIPEVINEAPSLTNMGMILILYI